MFLVLASALAAPAVSPFQPPAEHVFRPQLPLPRGGQYLEKYHAGEFTVLWDDDGEWFAEVIEQQLDLNWVLGSIYDAFYEHNGDEYQYLTILMVRDYGFFVAFYSPMANDVRGIGYDMYGPELWDTTEDSQVEGMIFMNYYGIWTANEPQSRYVFGQEFMHRWGSFVNVDHQSLDEDELLGRDVAHWSFWLDTPNSPMEGNDWVDNGDGTFTTDKNSGSTFSDLDLYLMGLVGPEEVGEQVVLQVTGSTPYAAEDTPIYLADTERTTPNVTVEATPVTFTLDDVIAAEGERSPSVDDSPKSFRMGMIILVQEDDVLDDAVLAEIEALRVSWEDGWEEDVQFLAELDTSLGENTSPCWPGTPEACAAEESPADDTGSPADADEDPAKEEEPAGCGCAGAPAPAWIAALGLAAVARRRRRS
ncbi:MAG: MYXO-CTERM sorting domain-containing protein [Myxococcota bacterium]